MKLLPEDIRLLADILARRASVLWATLQQKGLSGCSVEELADMQGALADELVEKGLIAGDQANAYGSKVERLIDLLVDAQDHAD